MANTKHDAPQRNCPSCGAPIVAEICAYCGSSTGLNTAEAEMEYPVLECKEATVNFWTLWFPAIFAVSFGFAGLIVITVFAFAFSDPAMLMVSAPFLLIGMAALGFVLRTVFRYLKVKRHGQTIQGTVYGYMDDNVYINGRPAQIVKLLVQTADGPRFILYQLGNTTKPYRIHETICLMVYQKFFLILRDKGIAHR